MKLRLLSVTVFTTLLVAGCSSTSGEGSVLGALKQFSAILDGTTPFVEESQGWEKYSIDHVQQGVTYSAATPVEAQFVDKKLHAEYPAAVDRLSRPFAVNDKLVKELDSVSTDHRFTYHNIMAVKAKQSGNVIGYCVSLDINLLENGQPTPWDRAGNIQKAFIYVAKDKPVSVATVDRDFIKRMCGEGFYNQYK